MNVLWIEHLDIVNNSCLSCCNIKTNSDGSVIFV